MRTSISYFLLALGICGALPLSAEAQTQAAPAVLQQAAQAGKYTFVVFCKQYDTTADKYTRAINAHLAAQPDRAATVAASLADPANKPLVDQFQVSRAPMPLVLAVAPNGAVTAAYQTEPTAKDVSDAMVSSAAAQCLKALQEGKSALMLIQPQAGGPLPAGAQQFLADPHFGPRTTLIELASADPAEAPFLQKLQVTPQEAAGSLVMMAPPGVYIGKFPLEATPAELVKKLASAKKCCNDANCKHNR